VHNDCLLLLLLLQFRLISVCTLFVAFGLSSSPKQSYQAQIDALSERLDHQDERFDQLESKLDHPIRAFEKSPMPDHPKASPHIAADFMVGGGDRRKMAHVLSRFQVLLSENVVWFECCAKWSK